MNRSIYNKINSTGFESKKVESSTIIFNSTGTQQWSRLFVGSSEGILHAYECQNSSNKDNPACNLKLSKIITSKDKKNPVQFLKVVELWHVLICILDGMLTVFDVESMEIIQQLQASKGCVSYSIIETNNLLILVGKKKLEIFAWTSQGLNLKREIPLNESPKMLIALNYIPGVVIGNKRSYEYIDLFSSSSSSSSSNPSQFPGRKIVDVSREHKMVGLELPDIPMRPAAILLSNGNQGVLVDISQYSENSLKEKQLADRLEWSSSPLALELSMPYILSLQSDGVEIHELASLMSLQKLQVSIPSVSFSNTQTFCVAGNFNKQILYVLTAEQLVVFQMDPLLNQIESLLREGQFQIAIDTIQSCLSPIQITRELAAQKNIHVSNIYNDLALMLHQKGDFDGSISNFIAAKAKPSDVISLFPDFISAALYAAFGTVSSGVNLPMRTSGNTVRLSGTILHRAASSLVTFCEYHRPRLRSYINRLILSSSSSSSSSSLKGSSSRSSIRRVDNNIPDLNNTQESDDSSYSSGGGGGGDKGRSQGENKTSSSPSNMMNLAEAQALAVLIDTVLLSALVNCSPTRRGAVLDLLTETPCLDSIMLSFDAAAQKKLLQGSINYHHAFGNQCHIESCAVVLASQGSAYTEPLLWLYRSHGDHKKTLSYLNEERCVNSSSKSSVGWTQHQFYQWTADYLRWLWFNEESTTPLAPLVLPSLKQVFEYDADLGLSVLTERPQGVSNSGGRGVSIQEIITFLEVITPGRSYYTIETILSQGIDYNSFIPLPLTNGRSLGISYLEWIIENGNVPVSTQDEYLLLLVEGIPMQLDVDHLSMDLKLSPEDSDTMFFYKLFRLKLQRYLRLPSSEFSAEKAIKALPKGLFHEYALILSKMGKHEEAIRIYCDKLRDIQSAEDYCDRVFTHGNNTMDKGVYLYLLKILITQSFEAQQINPKSLSNTRNNSPRNSESSDANLNSIQIAIEVLEKNYQRIDPLEFLKVLPKNIPLVYFTKYLNLVIEYETAKKRNLQIIHQLLRVKEVNIRTNSI